MRRQKGRYLFYASCLTSCGTENNIVSQDKRSPGPGIVRYFKVEVNARGGISSELGLELLDSAFDKISAKPYMDDDTLPSASTLIQTRYLLGQISPISGNIEQVSEVEEFILLFAIRLLILLSLLFYKKPLKQLGLL